MNNLLLLNINLYLNLEIIQYTIPGNIKLFILKSMLLCFDYENIFIIYLNLTLFSFCIWHFKLIHMLFTIFWIQFEILHYIFYYLMLYYESSPLSFSQFNFIFILHFTFRNLCIACNRWLIFYLIHIILIHILFTILWM